jgi:uncharacterized protein
VLPDEITKQLLEMLRTVDPHKVILFGSYAHGSPHGQSDVDVLVVTEDEFLPQNFSEKMAVYLKVSNAITELEKKIPIDLMVHTKAMHRKFLAMKSVFSRHIANQGKVLYEKTH